MNNNLSIELSPVLGSNVLIIRKTTDDNCDNEEKPVDDDTAFKEALETNRFCDGNCYINCGRHIKYGYKIGVPNDCSICLTKLEAYVDTYMVKTFPKNKSKVFRTSPDTHMFWSFSDASFYRTMRINFLEKAINHQ